MNAQTLGQPPSDSYSRRIDLLPAVILFLALNVRSAQNAEDFHVDFGKSKLAPEWELAVSEGSAKSTDFPKPAGDASEDPSANTSTAMATRRVKEGLLIAVANDQKFNLSRPTNLETIQAVEWEFTFQTPSAVGLQAFSFGIQWGKRGYQSVVFGRDRSRPMVRYHGTEMHYYGGPRWEPGKRYRVTFEMSVTSLKAFVHAADSAPWLYRKQDLPAWSKGRLTLSKSKGGGSRETSIILHSVKVTHWPAEELARMKDELAVKRKNWAMRSREILAWRNTIKEQPKVRVQFWDGSKTGYKPWALTELAERGDVVQSRGGLADPESLKDAGLSPAMYLFPRSHVKGTGDSYYLDPDFIRRSTAKTLELLKAWEVSGHPRLRVMLDSEYMAPPVDTPLVRRAAADAGALPAGAPWPKLLGKHRRLLGAPRGIIPDDDPGYRFLHWWHSAGSFIPLHKATAKAILASYPSVEVTTDPVMDRACIGQFAGMNMVQHWIRVHFRPRSPLSVPFYVERARVHQRSGGHRICIGPQLGNDRIAPASTPADMLTEACWLAVAFGASDITHWGYQYIHYSQFEYRPGGEAAWAALAKLNRELYLKHGKLLTTWEPTPRRSALWLSHCDAVHQGEGRYDFSFAMERAEDLFRAVLTTGEPFDVLYDDEIRAGALKHYRLLVAPDIRTTPADIASRIRDFIAAEGAVVFTDGARLAGVTGIRTAAIKWEEANHPREMSPSEYRGWLKRSGKLVLRAAGMKPRIQFAGTGAIASLMSTPADNYLVLVNDHRTLGEWAATHKNMAEDKGMPLDVTFKFDAMRMIDADTGEAFSVEDGPFRIRLEPGWGRILRIEK